MMVLVVYEKLAEYGLDVFLPAQMEQLLKGVETGPTPTTALNSREHLFDLLLSLGCGQVLGHYVRAVVDGTYRCQEPIAVQNWAVAALDAVKLRHFSICAEPHKSEEVNEDWKRVEGLRQILLGLLARVQTDQLEFERKNVGGEQTEVQELAQTSRRYLAAALCSCQRISHQLQLKLWLHHHHQLQSKMDATELYETTKRARLLLQTDFLNDHTLISSSSNTPSVGLLIETVRKLSNLDDECGGSPPNGVEELLKLLEDPRVEEEMQEEALQSDWQVVKTSLGGVYRLHLAVVFYYVMDLIYLNNGFEGDMSQFMPVFEEQIDSFRKRMMTQVPKEMTEMLVALWLIDHGFVQEAKKWLLKPTSFHLSMTTTACEPIEPELALEITRALVHHKEYFMAWQFMRHHNLSSAFHGNWELLELAVVTYLELGQWENAIRIIRSSIDDAVEGTQEDLASLYEMCFAWLEDVNKLDEIVLHFYLEAREEVIFKKFCLHSQTISKTNGKCVDYIVIYFLLRNQHETVNSIQSDYAQIANSPIRNALLMNFKVLNTTFANNSMELSSNPVNYDSNRSSTSSTPQNNDTMMPLLSTPEPSISASTLKQLQPHSSTKKLEINHIQRIDESSPPPSTPFSGTIDPTTTGSSSKSNPMLFVEQGSSYAPGQFSGRKKKSQVNNTEEPAFKGTRENTDIISVNYSSSSEVEAEMIDVDDEGDSATKMSDFYPPVIDSSPSPKTFLSFDTMGSPNKEGGKDFKHEVEEKVEIEPTSENQFTSTVQQKLESFSSSQRSPFIAQISSPPSISANSFSSEKGKVKRNLHRKPPLSNFVRTLTPTSAVVVRSIPRALNPMPSSSIASPSATNSTSDLRLRKVDKAASSSIKQVDKVKKITTPEKSEKIVDGEPDNDSFTTPSKEGAFNFMTNDENENVVPHYNLRTPMTERRSTRRTKKKIVGNDQGADEDHLYMTPLATRRSTQPKETPGSLPVRRNPRRSARKKY